MAQCRDERAPKDEREREGATTVHECHHTKYLKGEFCSEMQELPTYILADGQALFQTKSLEYKLINKTLFCSCKMVSCTM